MLSVGDTSFLDTLRAELRQKGVHERDLAEWLSTSVSTVSRRLSGKSEFRREEVAILDERLGENGALLLAAGYMPEHSELPRSRSFYFDEQSFSERFEEMLLLGESPAVPIAVIERSIKRLLHYLSSVKQERVVRKQKLRLELELLDRLSNRTGVTENILKRAVALQGLCEDLGDPIVAYEYESTLGDLYIGVDDYERGLAHQRRSYDLIRQIPGEESERLRTEITIARLLASSDPGSSEAAQLLEAAAPVLWTQGYEAWQWPQPEEGPSFLDVLHAQFALQVMQGDLDRASDTIGLIMSRFMTSPRVSDNITSLFSAAELYALDHQPAHMERHLAEAEALINRFEQHWFGNEADRIRALLSNPVQ